MVSGRQIQTSGNERKMYRSKVSVERDNRPKPYDKDRKVYGRGDRRSTSAKICFICYKNDHMADYCPFRNPLSYDRKNISNIY